MPQRALALLLLSLLLLAPGPRTTPLAQKKNNEAAAAAARSPAAALACLRSNRGEPLGAYRCLRRQYGPLDGDVKCLRAAYGDFIERVETDSKTGRPIVVLSDGARLVWDDGIAGKSFDDLLDRPDLGDMLAIPYRPGRDYDPPPVNDDPGRIRVEQLFKSVYGNTPAEVKANLVSVAWMPSHSKKKVRFNGQNGAAAALKKVIAELDRLPGHLLKYVTKTAGTFNWRQIAGTERLSVHSFGIAIDINVKYSDYWRWVMKKNPSLPYRNQIPLEIVEVFERHGFVWGGKWFHFDTMHFEYRPELFHPLCVGG
jgi:hypothetical protein